MKIATVERGVETNLAASTAFTLGNSAKMFSILSDKIYSDKPRALIREYACNALDIHTRVGQTRPFIVSLPSRLEPMLAFRDYGTGLRHDLVETLFCTYFASDKSTSNTELGGFGLGSKSAFAYTDTFTVTSFQAGVKSTYVCFKGNDGIPQMSALGEEPTDEPDGLEIKIPIKEVDRYTFEQTAKDILRWFPVGSFQVFGTTIDPVVPVMSTPLWMTRTGSNRHEVLMGPVAYKLDWSLVDPTIELPSSIVPIFSVGELDLPPSRETISYDPQTVKVLKERAALIIQEICSNALAQSKTLTPLARLQYLNDLQQSGLYSLFQKYHLAVGHTAEDDAGFKADPQGYKFKWGHYFERELERIRIPAPTSKRVWLSSPRRGNPGIEKKPTYESKLDLTNPNQVTNAYFIFNDLSEHHAPRVFDRLNELPKRSHYYLISPSPEVTSAADLQAILSDVPAEQFLTLSEITPPAKERKVVTSDVRIYALRGGNTYFYEDHRGPPTDGLWVPMTAASVDGGESRILNLRDLGWTDQPIWGFTKKAQKQILDNDFTLFEDFVKEELDRALSDENVVRAVHAKLIADSIPREQKRLFDFAGYRATSGLDNFLPDLVEKLRLLRADAKLVDPQLVRRVIDTMRLLELPPIKAVDHHGILPAVKKAYRKNKTLDLILRIQDRDTHLSFGGPDDSSLKQFVRN
jgi:hypothetical protein